MTKELPMAKKRTTKWTPRTVGGYPAGPRTVEEIGPPPPAFFEPAWLTEEEYDAMQAAAKEDSKAEKPVEQEPADR